MVKALNEMLLDLGDRTGSVMCCSMFYAVMDGPSGVGFFINAGHPMPFLCDKKKCAALHLGPRNMLLGVEDFEPEEACHTFVPGERLVLYTDGITDATDPDGQRFEEHRLHEAISRSVDLGAQQCVHSIFQAVEDFRQGARQRDDETLVVLDRI
jgi:serine phosphatase RsbU (regulator of sigma subunit)